MAMVIYPNAKLGFGDAQFDMIADDIKVLLVNSGYSYNAAHDFHDDVTGGNIVATSANLAGKSWAIVSTAAVFDATDIVFSAVNNGTITGVIIYKDTGVSGTSRLIGYDAVTSTATNGGDITVVWDSGANKIFALD